MSDYLPPKATIAEAVAWLDKNTGETWSLARIVETGIWPWFWLDYSPEHAHMFGDRFEGYAAQITYGCDKQRLLENTSEPDFVVTMFWAPEGILSPDIVLVRTTPIFLPMSALRFARDDIQRVADVTNKSSQTYSGHTGEESDSAVSASHPDSSEAEPEKRLVGWKADAVENWLTILQLSKGEPDARGVAKFLVNIGTLFKVAGKRDAYTWKPTNSSDGREKSLSLKTIQNSMPELFEMAATRKNPG